MQLWPISALSAGAAAQGSLGTGSCAHVPGAACTQSVGVREAKVTLSSKEQGSVPRRCLPLPNSAVGGRAGAGKPLWLHLHPNEVNARGLKGQCCFVLPSFFL